MMVSITIIGILSAVVIANFGSFDSTTLLKASAYDIASMLRQAQVYSVSVLGSSDDFNTPYGVTFTPDTQEYQFFRFVHASDFPIYDGVLSQNVGSPSFLSRSMTITDLCLNARIAGSVQHRCNSTSPTTITRLDISFRRPEFKALFHVEGLPASVVNPDNNGDGNIESVEIELQSTREPGNRYLVVVGLLGHISVQQVP
jgi:hypothetical protein